MSRQRKTQRGFLSDPIPPPAKQILAIAIGTALLWVGAAPNASAQGATGDSTNGELTLANDVDYAFGWGPQSSETEGGLVNAGPGLCIGCSYSGTEYEDFIFGAVGNYKYAQEDLTVSGGQVVAQEAEFFDGTDLKVDLIGITGNAIVGTAGGALSASNGSVSLVDTTVHREGGKSDISPLIAGNYISAQDGSAQAVDGSVTLTGGRYEMHVYGNFVKTSGTANLEATGGHVEMRDAYAVSAVGNYVYLFNSAEGRSVGGSVEVINSTIEGGNVLGSHAFTQRGRIISESGSVYIESSNIDATGGGFSIAGSSSFADYTGTAESIGGRVDILNSTVTVAPVTNSYQGVLGSYAYSSSSSASGGELGAHAAAGTVTIDGGTISDRSGDLYILGSLAKTDGSSHVLAETGSVTVSNVSLTGTIGGGRARTAINGNASVLNNRAELRSTVLDGDVYAGYSQVTSGTSGDSTASGNAAVIIDSNAGYVAGGYAVSWSGGTVAANSNTVTFESGVIGSICGGFTYSSYSSGSVESADSTGNQIVIGSENGTATINSAVWGSYVQANEAASVSACGNTITILGSNVDISQASLVGGYAIVSSAAAIDDFTGNTLSFQGFRGSVAELVNFETIHVAVDAAQAAGWGKGADKSIIHVTGEDGIYAVNSTADTTVNLTVGNAALLQQNSSYTVIAGTNADELIGGKLTFNDTGLVAVYAAWDDSTPDELNINILQKEDRSSGGIGNNPVIGMSMLIAQGMFIDELRPQKGLFAIAKAYRSETDLHADTKVSGVSVMLGAAGDVNVGSGDMLRIAGFIEAGRGDLESSVDGSKADGDGDYYAVGVQASYFLESGLYAEASIRGGRTNTDAAARIDENMPFDMRYSAGFAAAHIGAGFNYQLSDHLTLSPYARYQYMRFGADSDVIMEAEYSWDAYTVQKTALGLDLAYVQNDWTWTAGAAWERIFDADAVSTYADVDMTSWDLSGDSFLVRGSLKHVLASDPRWSVEADVRGRFGEYQGVAGMLTVIRQW